MILRSGSWQSPPVRVATSRRDRLHGLRRQDPPGGLLIETRCVHSFGMQSAVWTVRIAAGVVVDVGWMPPRRMRWWRAPGWVLELPADVVPPTPGREVRLLPDGPEDVSNVTTELGVAGDDQQ
ncbi:MAG: hypothetical protein HKN74_06685 [Acidimicrobiia bacterium]|nr:hypothetical protein [Acidimicrobiia bacterium]NNF09951.1 hypothetical protein [Acidimicrobiia bacterium]NNL68720.1 hypothetical protein [Acidimicrobiia bacterium]